jgi:hypothetical protein
LGAAGGVRLHAETNNVQIIAERGHSSVRGITLGIYRADELDLNLMQF